jgi:hypothetical protein
MPRYVIRKKKPKQKRNCLNETQIRDEKTGYFLRRRDDVAVTRFVDARLLCRQGLAESLERFPRRNKRPQHERAA